LWKSNGRDKRCIKMFIISSFMDDVNSHYVLLLKQMLSSTAYLLIHLVTYLDRADRNSRTRAPE